MNVGQKRLSLFEVVALLFSAAVPFGAFFFILRGAEEIGSDEEI